MTTFQLYAVDVSTVLPLLFADDGIRAGFPSPAQDYIRESIDLNRTLIIDKMDAAKKCRPP